MLEVWVQILPIILSGMFAIIGFLTYRLINSLDKQIVDLQGKLGPLGKDLKEVTKELHGVQKELQFMWRLLDDIKHKGDRDGRHSS